MHEAPLYIIDLHLQTAAVPTLFHWQMPPLLQAVLQLTTVVGDKHDGPLQAALHVHTGTVPLQLQLPPFAHGGEHGGITGAAHVGPIQATGHEHRVAESRPFQTHVPLCAHTREQMATAGLAHELPVQAARQSQAAIAP